MKIRTTADVGAGNSRLYILDLLRFIAAASVMGFHLLVDDGGAWGPRADEVFGFPIETPLKYGWMGVEFFFVISGFVICMSSWGRSLSGFFTSRFTRLMPAYIFAVLFTTLIVTAWPRPSGVPQPTHVLVNLTMLQGFVGVPSIDVVYWTLFAELKFYIYFGLVVYFGLTYRRVVTFCAVWLIVSLFARYSGSDPFIAAVNADFAPYFIAGITLYLIYRFRPNLLLWILLATSVALSFTSLTVRVNPKYNTSAVAIPVMLCFFAIMVGVSLGWFARLRWRWLTVLGSLTYPVYLLHRELARTLIRGLHTAVNHWVLLGIAVGMILGLAYAVHRYIETPLAKMLRRKLTESFAQIRSAEQVSTTRARHQAVVIPRAVAHEITTANDATPTAAPSAG